MAQPFHQVVEEIHGMNLEEKRKIRDITDKLIIEERREEIRRNGEEARRLAAEGKLSFGSAKDVISRLNEDN